MSNTEKVEQWLAENQPNVAVEDIVTISTASLILGRVGLCLTGEEAKAIFPNLGLYPPYGERP